MDDISMSILWFDYKWHVWFKSSEGGTAAIDFQSTQQNVFVSETHADDLSLTAALHLRVSVIVSEMFNYAQSEENDCKPSDNRTYTTYKKRIKGLNYFACLFESS